MGFFDNLFGNTNGKERTTKAAARRRANSSSSSSSNSRTAAGKQRKAEALKKFGTTEGTGKSLPFSSLAEDLKKKRRR